MAEAAVTPLFATPMAVSVLPLVWRSSSIVRSSIARYAPSRLPWRIGAMAESSSVPSTSTRGLLRSRNCSRLTPLPRRTK